MEEGMKYDCIIIGAGLSGLTAAALLAKRGLSVAVCEHSGKPGGSCGVFKRLINGKAAAFDQGSSMLFGFGPQGFNSHRFLFNCLEEPINIIRHEYLYAVNYNGRKIRFSSDIDAFTDELSDMFPRQRENIVKFYSDMRAMYDKVICERPDYTTPDEISADAALKGMMKHPLSYFRFLSYMNISTRKLLDRYFDDEDIMMFFDKLTSTYCYATVEEAPAIMVSVMFIDNHVGGSWYPAGSTLFLPGILEKVIEENSGHMYYNTTVEKILFQSSSGCISAGSHPKAAGVITKNGSILISDNVVFSGTVWDLYNKLLPDEMLTEEMVRWTASQAPTYPASVLYALVKRNVIDEDVCAIEMLAAPPGIIDETEITVYIPTMDDPTLCDEHHHVVIAIGPSAMSEGLAEGSFSDTKYRQEKIKEADRMTDILEGRFPGIKDNMVYRELATPFTIQRYTMKKGGAAAGPKQKLGQHMMKRQSIRTAWTGLFCCGESTTMGTGTPTVTVSGIAAANAVLRRFGKAPYVWQENMKNYVNELSAPLKKSWMRHAFPDGKANLMEKAGRCLFCEKPACCSSELLDIPGIMRRTACGNFKGAADLAAHSLINITEGFLRKCEEKCIQANDGDTAEDAIEGVEISRIVGAICDIKK